MNIRQTIEQLALTWEGKQHRALADAENTANILLKVYSERDINKRYKRHGELELVKRKTNRKSEKKDAKMGFKELKKNTERPLNGVHLKVVTRGKV